MCVEKLGFLPYSVLESDVHQGGFSRLLGLYENGMSLGGISLSVLVCP